jgi:hypothetical protein
MCADCRKANPERGVDFRSEDTGPDETCIVEGTCNGDGTMIITKITRSPAAKELEGTKYIPRSYRRDTGHLPVAPRWYRDDAARELAIAEARKPCGDPACLCAAAK